MIKRLFYFTIYSLFIVLGSSFFLLPRSHPALAQSLATCPQILVNYGQDASTNLSLDKNADGKINLLDCITQINNSGLHMLTETDIVGETIITASGVSQRTSGAEYGELLVKLKSISPDEHELADLKQLSGIETVQRLQVGNIKHPNLTKITLVDKSPKGTAEFHNLLALQIMNSVSNMEIVNANWLSFPAKKPNDPLYPQQTHHKAIKSELAWNKVTDTTQLPNLVAAVLGDGVFIAHEDLHDNLFGNRVEYEGLPGVDDDNNGFIDDIYGVDMETQTSDPSYDLNCGHDGVHETAVNGVLAAVGDNNSGLAGTNWNARILNIKISKSTDCLVNNSFFEIQALMYAKAMEVPVVVSARTWKCYAPSDTNYANPPDVSVCTNSFQILNQEIRNFTHDAQGNIRALYVSAVQNTDDTGPWIDKHKDLDILGDIPCSFDNPAIVCVTGTQGIGATETFNWNLFGYGKNTVDLAAPGDDIYTTYAPYPGPPPNSALYIDGLTGTSFATPQVGGAVLLVKQSNPSLTMEQVRDIIFNTVDTDKEVPSFGRAHYGTTFLADKHALEGKVKTNGRLNIYEAVKCAIDPALTCLKQTKKEDWNLEAMEVLKLRGDNQVRGVSTKAGESQSDQVLGLASANNLSFEGKDNVKEIGAAVIDAGVAGRYGQGWDSSHPDIKKDIKNGNYWETVGNPGGLNPDANNIEDPLGVSVALNDNGTLKNPWYKTKANGDALEPFFLQNSQGQPICGNDTLDVWDWITYRGTGVNSIIASENNNGIAKKARILNVNIFDVKSTGGPGDCFTSAEATIKALEYVAQLQVPVTQLNTSLVCWGTECQSPIVNQLKAAVCRYTHGNDTCSGAPKALLITHPMDITMPLVKNIDISGGLMNDLLPDDFENTFPYQIGYPQSTRLPSIENTDFIKFYPCQFDNPAVICVTGTRQHLIPEEEFRMERMDFTNSLWGPLTVDLAAPARNLIAATVPGTGNLNNNTEDPSDQYAYRDGTSYAAAHITGTILLMIEAGMANGQTPLKPLEIKDILIKTVDTKYQIASFNAGYWQYNPNVFYQCETPTDCVLEGKMVSNGRANAYEAVLCAYTRECLYRENQITLPINYKDMNSEIQSNAQAVAIVYQPNFSGANVYPTQLGIDSIIEFIRTNLTQKGYHGAGNGPIQIISLPRDYNNPEESVDDFQNDHCHFLGSEILGNFVKCTRKKIYDYLKNLRNQGIMVASVGYGSGASLNMDLINHTELAGDPGIKFISLGAPSEDDMDVNAGIWASTAIGLGPNGFYYENPNGPISAGPATLLTASGFIEIAQNEVDTILNKYPTENYSMQLPAISVPLTEFLDANYK